MCGLGCMRCWGGSLSCRDASLSVLHLASAGMRCGTCPLHVATPQGFIARSSATGEVA